MIVHGVIIFNGPTLSDMKFGKIRPATAPELSIVMRYDAASLLISDFCVA